MDERDPRRRGGRVTERLHVTRSRAKPGGAAPVGRRRGPVPLAQAAVAEGEGAGRPELPPHRAPDAREVAAHRLRGGELPQHRRVLGARHRHVHDPRRHLHAPLRLLQREVRRARPGRPRRAAARRPRREADGAASLRRHLGGPRRPARRRRGRVRGHDPRDPQARAGLRGRGADARLPRPGDAARARDRRAARRLQPQRRDRAAAVSRRRAAGRTSGAPAACCRTRSAWTPRSSRSPG